MQRLKIYQQTRPSKRFAIDDRFHSESREIPKLLADYIREHREKFKHLK